MYSVYDKKPRNEDFYEIEDFDRDLKSMMVRFDRVRFNIGI